MRVENIHIQKAHTFFIIFSSLPYVLYNKNSYIPWAEVNLAHIFCPLSMVAKLAQLLCPSILFSITLLNLMVLNPLNTQ